MLELDEKSAKDLNDLCEYADSLSTNQKFSVGHYTADVLGGQTKESYTYYMSLQFLAERLMKKYKANWLSIDDFGDMWSNWETRSFLDQGGFKTLLTKEKGNWSNRNPILLEFIKGGIAAFFAISVSIIVSKSDSRENTQLYKQQSKRLDSLLKKVDSLANRKTFVDTLRIK